MSNYLQELLTAIEAKAVEQSELAVMNASVVESAYTLRDALRRVGCDAVVSEHYHYKPKLRISISYYQEKEQELRDACHAIGFHVDSAPGQYVYAPGVEVSLRLPAKEEVTHA